MARHQNILISTRLEPARHQLILTSALLHWPFLDPTHKFVSSSERLVINLPDLTDDDSEQYDLRLEQNYLVRNELPAWSKEFPDTSFAFIETDSFGGNSVYRGCVILAGSVLLESDSLTALLNQMGIASHGAFPKIL